MEDYENESYSEYLDREEERHNAEFERADDDREERLLNERGND